MVQSQPEISGMRKVSNTSAWEDHKGQATMLYAL